MKTALKISQTVIKRISDTTKPCLGKLYGILFKNNIIILALQAEVDTCSNLLYSLPAEVDFCGVFKSGDNDTTSPWIRQSTSEIYVTDSPIYINFNLEEKKLSTFIILNDRIEPLQYTVVTEPDLNSQFIHLRLLGNLPVKCEASIRAVEEVFNGLRKLVTSNAVAFTFEKSNVFLLGNDYDNPILGISGDNTVSEMLEEGNDMEGAGKKKKQDLQVINVNLLRKNSEQDLTEIKSHAPICVLDKRPMTVFNISLNLDGLAIVNRQLRVSKLHGILVESAIRKLRLYEHVLLSNLRENEDNQSNIQVLETFHFYPSECGHFVTRIYPHVNEEELKKERAMLHAELLVSSEIPMFRRGNQFDFLALTNKNSPLLNPHEYVKKSDNGGQVSLVKGKYLYYHYCQDNMDDKGWGCAYRSLQTLASWYKLQGFTEKDVPTFKEIQKCLVDIEDKPASFINSRQWIGSTEVGFVLDTLLGVTCKILFASSGEEMSTKGPELVNHFENHGSPVMIGGGVLAHTILGVDYNRDTGSLKFLILDPHYTGGEDLQVITSKGWCGWKGCEFWDKSAHYNMCLPQVPRGV